MADELKGSLATLGQRAETAAPTVATQVIREAAAGVVAKAKGPWPVKSGRSKEALGVQPIPNGARIETDEVDYAVQIVSHGVRPWDAYVLQPMLVLARDVIPQEIGRRLIAELERGA